MSKIFISHSSKDKEFVNRLSAYLVAEGFPVWLDTWEITVGDSLLDKIFQGIDGSSYLIAVISNNSVKSQWVQDELKAAKMREKQENRKLLVPVLLDDCSLPLFLADRLYVSFRDSFTEGVSDVMHQLEEFGVQRGAVPTAEQKIPLLFDEGVHLDRSLLRTTLLSLLNHSEEGLEIKPHQIWDVRDAAYIRLRRALMKAADGTPTSLNVSVEKLDLYRSVTKSITDCERAMTTGIASLLNRLLQDPKSVSGFMESCYWYCKAIRWDVYGMFNRYAPAREILEVPYPLESYEGRPFSSNKSVEKFYDIEQEVGVVVFDEMERFRFTVHVDRSSKMAEDLLSLLGSPQPLKYYWGYEFIYNYLYPQRLYSFYLNEVMKSDIPLIWAPQENLMIGIS
jgi:hypothetical protein